MGKQSERLKLEGSVAAELFAFHNIRSLDRVALRVCFNRYVVIHPRGAGHLDHVEMLCRH